MNNNYEYLTYDNIMKEIDNYINNTLINYYKETLINKKEANTKHPIKLNELQEYEFIKFLYFHKYCYYKQDSNDSFDPIKPDLPDINDLKDLNDRKLLRYLDIDFIPFIAKNSSLESLLLTTIKKYIYLTNFKDMAIKLCETLNIKIKE